MSWLFSMGRGKKSQFWQHGLFKAVTNLKMNKVRTCKNETHKRVHECYWWDQNFDPLQSRFGVRFFSLSNKKRMNPFIFQKFSQDMTKRGFVPECFRPLGCWGKLFGWEIPLYLKWNPPCNDMPWQVSGTFKENLAYPNHHQMLTLWWFKKMTSQKDHNHVILTFEGKFGISNFLVYKSLVRCI